MSLRGEAPIAGPHRTERGHSAERGFSAAFELVATPTLFGFLGYFIDGRLGTSPLFTIALSLFVASYVVWKLWYQYNAQMVELEAELIGVRTGGLMPSPESEVDAGSIQGRQ